MYDRDLEAQLTQGASYYPIVTLTGPRQSGKTTLVRKTFPNHYYINLEDPDTLERIQEDPKFLLKKHAQNGMIIDEVQKMPQLLSYLQVITDEEQRPGQFIVTGSHQLSMMEAVTQSLAGRTAILTLYPLTFSELGSSGLHQDLNALLLKGFYPRCYQHNLPPEQHSKYYIATYIERDVRTLSNIKDSLLFTKFIKLCATRIGQILKVDNLCNEIGISHQTAKQWLSILEASYIIKLLQPYYDNLGKRLIKSPKLYFVDTGLASYLLGIYAKEQLANHPLRGQLFENMVVMDMIKHITHTNMSCDCYYYRDHNGNEVDLLIQQGESIIPIEIKSSQTFHRQFLKGLDYFMQITNKAQRGYLVYSGESTPIKERIYAYHYGQATELLNQPGHTHIT